MRIDGLQSLLESHQAWIFDHLLVPNDLVNSLLYVFDFLFLLFHLSILLRLFFHPVVLV